MIVNSEVVDEFSRLLFWKRQDLSNTSLKYEQFRMKVQELELRFSKACSKYKDN